MAYLNALIHSAPRLITNGSARLFTSRVYQTTRISQRSGHICPSNKSIQSKPLYFIVRKFTSFKNLVYRKNTFACKQQSRPSSGNIRSFEINTNLPKDVLVYAFKNDNFYKALSVFGLFQMAMWGYLSTFAVQYLKHAPSSTADTGELPWWKVLLYKEGQYKSIISVMCLVLGGTVLFITAMYPRRVIRNLWILKGGREVDVTTYTFLGRTQSSKIPLDHISCMQSRTGSKQYIPLKIKDKAFYYLIDKQGEFYNTELFDFMVGLKRNFK